jgi:uncharacterized protein YwgA
MNRNGWQSNFLSNSKANFLHLYQQQQQAVTLLYFEQKIKMTKCLLFLKYTVFTLYYSHYIYKKYTMCPPR